MVAWKLDVWHPRGTCWNSAPDCIFPFSPTGGVKGYGPEEKELISSAAGSPQAERKLLPFNSVGRLCVDVNGFRNLIQNKLT